MLGQTRAASRAAVSRRGFSLIELILVLVIMAILAAIATPRYSAALTNYRAESAARRIVSDIRLLQARAKSTSSSQTLTFTIASAQYQIAGMADPDRPTQTYTVNLGSDPYLVSISSASFGNSSSGSTASLVFNGYGVPTAGGTVVVVCGAVTKTVTVDATNGTVSFQ